jgi:hypothetical protein
MPRTALRLPALLVATALFTIGCGLPEKFTADRENFSAALDSFIEASNQLNNAAGPSGTAQMTASLSSSMLSSIDAGLTSADAVSDEFLDWLHPEMKTQFRDNLVAGQRALASAIRANDPGQMSGAQQRLEAWMQYWNENGEKLNQKAKP